MKNKYIVIIPEIIERMVLRLLRKCIKITSEVIITKRKYNIHFKKKALGKENNLKSKCLTIVKLKSTPIYRSVRIWLNGIHKVDFYYKNIIK